MTEAQVRAATAERDVAVWRASDVEPVRIGELRRSKLAATYHVTTLSPAAIGTRASCVDRRVRGEVHLRGPSGAPPRPRVEHRRIGRGAAPRVRRGARANAISAWRASACRLVPGDHRAEERATFACRQMCSPSTAASASTEIHVAGRMPAAGRDEALDYSKTRSLTGLRTAASVGRCRRLDQAAE